MRKMVLGFLLCMNVGSAYAAEPEGLRPDDSGNLIAKRRREAIAQAFEFRTEGRGEWGLADKIDACACRCVHYAILGAGFAVILWKQLEAMEARLNA